MLSPQMTVMPAFTDRNTGGDFPSERVNGTTEQRNNGTTEQRNGRPTCHFCKYSRTSRGGPGLARGLLKDSDGDEGRRMVGCKFFAFLGAAGLSLLTSGARCASFQLNCDGRATPQRMALGLREAVENNDPRKPLSDFLVMTLPFRG